MERLDRSLATKKPCHPLNNKLLAAGYEAKLLQRLGLQKRELTEGGKSPLLPCMFLSVGGSGGAREALGVVIAPPGKVIAPAENINLFSFFLI